MSLVAHSRVQDLFGIGDEADSVVWDEATLRARECLPPAARPRAQVDAALQVAELVLLEGQYGPQHYRLSRAKRLYYRVRPLMTPAARRVLRRAVVRRGAANGGANWPVDDRYVRHAEDALQAACLLQPPLRDEVRPFWPQGKRFALVLTHDVESAEGLARIWDLVEVEERVGVRSSFNLVAGEYPVDMALVRELHARGFEVGVHGWRHDGRMFESLSRFDGDCVHINQTLREWGAVGFRSPMTHRHPVPMQELAVEYDSSFFDTDPFEPISGGVMTIWPFFMGRFVELPYTLPQDHTLIETMGETTPRLWIEKSRFIGEHGGMALLNSHPEYLCLAGNLHMYQEFLDAVCCEGDAWRALPKDIAAWWRTRQARCQATIAGAGSGDRLGCEQLVGASQTRAGRLPRDSTLSPPPTPPSLEVGDYAALNVGQGCGEFDDFTIERYRQFARYLPDRCQRVLDMGCGYGRGGVELRLAVPNVSLTGIDCIPGRVDAVPRDIYDEALVANATCLPFAGGSFDAVVAGEFIEHLTPLDVDKALAEIRRVLKPGGRLLLTTPNPDSLKLRLLGGSVLKSHHLSAHSHRALARRLEGLGYVGVVFRGSGRATRRFGDRVPFLWLYGSYLMCAVSP